MSRRGRGSSPILARSSTGQSREPPALARAGGAARLRRDLHPLRRRLARPWFESDPIKAILGFDGIVGTYASPYAAGTAYVLLHHCFGEVNGKKGVWGHAIGGMGAITQAMARACAARGVEIRTAPRSARSWWRTVAQPASSRRRARKSRRAPSSPTSIRSSPSKSSSIRRRCPPTFAPASRLIAAARAPFA